MYFYLQGIRPKLTEDPFSSHAFTSVSRSEGDTASQPLAIREKRRVLWYSLVAPVEPHGDVPLDLAGLVLGEVTLDQLPTQVDELVHHMAQLVEQIHLVFLSWQETQQKRGSVRTQLGRLLFCSVLVKSGVYCTYLLLQSWCVCRCFS